MDRDEALKLLRGGEDGVRGWNRRREESLEIPDLTGVNVSGAALTGADLRDANFTRAILTRANLSRAILTRGDFTHADLSRGDFTGADLTHANLRGANLTNTSISNCNLRHADLRTADLRDADLRGADLTSANLSGSDLENANLNGATLFRTFFSDVDLSTVDSLDGVRHDGPSSIGIDTLQKSKGKIPEEFLRGCGLSPWEIEMAKLYNPDLKAHEVVELVSTGLTGERADSPLYLGGVFISYSHSEAEIADKLREKLHFAGASVWLDRHDAIAGSLNKQIQREIRLRDVVVLILSETSVKSDWVEHELKSTRNKEKEEDRDVLCPIAVDDSWKEMMGNPNWGHLSDKLILDFSAWKTKAFDKQFDKLLKGMKINYEVRK